MAFDQPLYAIAKQIQWQWSNSHGEKHYVIMFGGLHVEMTALKAIGKLLEDSGWTSALIQSGVASAGKADSFLKALHVSRARHVHQVTASALHILMYDAYKKYWEDMNADVPPEFDKWRLQQEEARRQFLYWSTTLHFELIIPIFIRSLRERNFKLYIDALVSLMPWFFALNHTNYGRWLPVHIRDMILLEESHPAVFAESMSGNFVMQRHNAIFLQFPLTMHMTKQQMC